ncbi:CDP-diacylglycerol--glycerol-3-phosphate 3-phosphatidyltransferase, mitochondrial [Seminavis robusta]|uniref:CDP-diacylglycerol--glycerol-3-phosphate 3-phosphatidyltransferase n=1 Tax=Seminavis robusta TaxID=568900 RepID=A0A9N8H318_9STRA|nr:CDP-diacylglycerol--glycerol-3-phosphate 3-phosphatidyltransferase, mitochondrial [Seminavis robusta]|eukprot:Sro29_g019100.1 CDP-diacylglycerol--glycerol-3-phosphate 3-phosphatidyltransferase, mitochondrial (553) ;mRNA; r:64507-66165
MNRKKLLDAARGVVNGSVGARKKDSPDRVSDAATQSRSLRCFPLQQQHVEEAFTTSTPGQFHSLLCEKIRKAKTRVSLASLYVGPAASPTATPREQDFLDALEIAAAKPQVQVNLILDKNRALRPVPLSADANAATTSSAQAVFVALTAGGNHGDKNNNLAPEAGANNLFLASVLSPSMQYILPNPFNEVAGVFHMKAYLIDDELIISGANLSEEYFVDRHDRYLHFTKGGAGLVDFYHELIQILCDHADVYSGENSSVTPNNMRQPTTKTQFVQALNEFLTIPKENDTDEPQDDFMNNNSKSKTVAVVVPTFQAPESFFSGSTTQRGFPDDIEVTRSLLECALEQQKLQDKNSTSETVVRLSSAYLNPTDNLLKVLAEFSHIEFLTAGRTSHGFAPKKKAGNKGKDWIPTVFETLSRDACQHLEAAKLLYYERPGWTFHAKGLWLEEGKMTHGAKTSVVAAICGSGNYGARSETLDVESNCVLIIPSGSPLQQPLKQEWTNMLEYTSEPPLSSIGAGKADSTSGKRVKEGNSEAPLSWPLQVCLPILRKFL